MLFDERYDFSLESDLKPELWNKIEQKMKQSALPRSEVSLDSISNSTSQKKTHQISAKGQNDAKPEKMKGALTPKK